MNNKDLKEIIVSEEEINKQIIKTAKMIDAKYQDEPIVLVGMLKGAYVYTASLAKHIKNPNVTVEFMVVSSYRDGESTGKLNIKLDLKHTNISDKNIIIVEDIVDTGLTLSKIVDRFKNNNAKSVEVVTMLNKPSNRKRYVEITYPTINIKNEIVVGYGLDYNEMYRHLPYIAVISDEGYKKYKKEDKWKTK